MKWLHISDLHFNNAEENGNLDTIIDKLIETIIEEHIEAEFLFITGDFRYATAKNIIVDNIASQINKLMQAANIESSNNLFLVPGNHDIDRKKNTSAYDKAIHTGYNSQSGQFSSELIPALNKRLDFFIELSNIVKPGNQSWCSNPLFNTHSHLCMDECSFLFLNTAIASGSHNERGKLVTGYSCLAKSFNEIKKCNSGKPIIALGHHGLECLFEDERKAYEQLFLRNNVGLYLCGDAHNLWFRKINNTIEITMGCLNTPSSGTTTAFSYGVLDESNYLKIDAYKYDYSFFNWAKHENFNKGIKELLSLPLPVVKKEKWESRALAEVKTTPFTPLEAFVKEYFLDNVIKQVCNSYGITKKKASICIEIFDRIASYGDGRKFQFNKFIKRFSSNDMPQIEIAGYQGTGKSTLASLIYMELRKSFHKSRKNPYPVLIDIDKLDGMTKKDAMNILDKTITLTKKAIAEEALERIIFIIDGIYTFKNSTESHSEYIQTKLAKIAGLTISYINVVGEAYDIPKRRLTKAFTSRSTETIRLKQVRYDDSQTISIVIEKILELRDFLKNEEIITTIKSILKKYRIYQIDFRSIITIINIYFDKKNKDQSFAKGLHNYCLSLVPNMKSYAKQVAAYMFSKSDQRVKNSRVIKTTLVRDYLIAYHYLSCVVNYKDNKTDIGIFKEYEFVFTPSINSLIKEMLTSEFAPKKELLMTNLITIYNSEQCTLQMKSQICYTLGRMEPNSQIIVFLSQEQDTYYSHINRREYFSEKYGEDHMHKTNLEIILYRTISLSLIWLDYFKYEETYLKCLLRNERLNDINRGFHIEYYADQEYHTGEEPTYNDQINSIPEKTVEQLLNSISHILYSEKGIYKALHSDIITLFSIFQYRMNNDVFIEKYEERLLKLAQRLVKSPKIKHKLIYEYLDTILLSMDAKNFYVEFFSEMYNVKSERRTGWVKRGVSLADQETIAEHMYGCWVLGSRLLPDDLHLCTDYSVDVHGRYKEYDKNKILNTLLIHDFAEAKYGDKIVGTKTNEDKKNEKTRHVYYQYTATFPFLFGWKDQSSFYNNFGKDDDINGLIARDIDIMENLFQAIKYKSKYAKEISLTEWYNWVTSNLQTELCKQIFIFVTDRIVEPYCKTINETVKSVDEST